MFPRWANSACVFLPRLGIDRSSRLQISVYTMLAGRVEWRGGQDGIDVLCPVAGFATIAVGRVTHDTSHGRTS
jgi:hypothetical protein